MRNVIERVRRAVCCQAVLTFGATHQAGKAMEECGELVRAVNRFFISENKGHDRAALHNLAEEVADVELMCEQIRCMIGDAIVDNKKARKVLRLRERLGMTGRVVVTGGAAHGI